jgi:serine/threonine-protein kinase
VVRIIGEGGMGLVYEAIHVRLQQRVAIKLLQPRVLNLPEVVARFEREARAACRLKSRNSVRILDVDHTTAGLAYMVMEYLEGRDLSEELEARVRLRPAEAVDFILQACSAMSEAHASGVIHRDLKPSNLFLVPEGDRVVVKVLDFGISKITSETDAQVTSTFATMGTPLYMSPEQIRSTKNVDARTDIWALGVILYEALTGERPFSGETTTAAAAAIVADGRRRCAIGSTCRRGSSAR